MKKSYSFLKSKNITLVGLLYLFLASCSVHSMQDENKDVNDPFETYNRKVHSLNKALDKTALLPASQVYGSLIPQSLRLSAATFHGNLQEPKHFTNHLVQGQFSKASVDFGRFVINSTVGMLGLFDIASRFNLFPEKTEFDETFAYWSVPTGPYLELPFVGPSSVRGSLGLMSDYIVNPLLMLSSPIASLSFATFEIVNIINSRYEYSNAFDSLLYGSSDSYSSSRLTYLQQSKKMGQVKDRLTTELFDPSEDF